MFFLQLELKTLQERKWRMCQIISLKTFGVGKMSLVQWSGFGFSHKHMFSMNFWVDIIDLHKIC